MKAHHLRVHLVVIGSFLGLLDASIVLVFAWNVVVGPVRSSIRDEKRLALVVWLVYHGRYVVLILLK